MSMRAISYRTKVFVFVLLAVMLASVVTHFYGQEDLEDQALETLRSRMFVFARLCAATITTQEPGHDHLVTLAQTLHLPTSRLTLMDANGSVLEDIHDGVLGTPRHEDHDQRPEVRDARLHGEGYAIRWSDTLDDTYTYTAIRLDDGRILRFGVSLRTLQHRSENLFAVLTRMLIVATVAALVLAGLSAVLLRRSISNMLDMLIAISRGDLSRRLHSLPGTEFAPLVDAVNVMAANIHAHVRSIADKNSQLSAILRTMSDGVLVLGESGNIRSVNPALHRLVPNLGQVEGKPLDEALPIPELQREVRALLALPAPDASCDRLERSLSLRFADGRHLAVTLTRPLGGTAAGLPCLVAVFHDVTEFARLVQVRRDFVANVSHELRTPLTAIQGYAETIVALQASPESTRFADVILKNSAYLAHMVDELLLLARLEDRQAPPDLSPTAVDEALAEAAELCRVPLERRGLRLQNNLPSPCTVWGHPTHLVRIFRNLLENAAQYAPAGSTIRVAAHVRECAWPCLPGQDVQPTREYVIRVVDDGPGIPPIALEHVCERFFQVERNRTRTSAGLGLYIVKHMVESQGGRVWAESPASDGSTALVFTLALCEQHEGAREIPESV